MEGTVMVTVPFPSDVDRFADRLEAGSPMPSLALDPRPRHPD